mmetsp:Transcript_20129/g.58204  ORF Transcript_20129/g.58204 Transcript_20129/m.58204 type:complete len:83 (-) Transcript_20129:15-263(-)
MWQWNLAKPFLNDILTHCDNYIVRAGTADFLTKLDVHSACECIFKKYDEWVNMFSGIKVTKYKAGKKLERRDDLHRDRDLAL